MLVADIGNSRASFGLFQGKNLKATFHIAAENFLDENKVEQELTNNLQDKLYHSTQEERLPQNLVVASVNPKINNNLERVLRNFFQVKPQFLTWQSKKNIELMIENPQTLGIDRIANAVAARSELHSAAIIIDIGTAITVDYLNGKGEFMGGAIVPGPLAGIAALRVFAPHLPEIEVAKPENIIGKFTKEAVQSGIYYGWLTMMEGLVQRFQKQGADPKAKIILTGGLGPTFFSDFSIPVILDENLTLKGVKILADLNI